MSKIGVGVGDEFPLDDGNNGNPNAQNAGATPSTPEDDRAEFEEWKRRRDAWRAQKEQWRAQRDEWHRRRHEWKQQWREQRHAWREEMRAKFGDDHAHMYGGRRHGRGRFRVQDHDGPRVLAVVGVVAILIVALTHIGYVIAGLAAVGLLWAAYHHFGHDPLDVGPYGADGYGRPGNNPSSPPVTMAQKPADNTGNGQQTP